ncbi:MAG: iron-containing alcohol dehydrogenase [Sporomusaceae bacterium]|nr:iron-containing alcohol dehydrogenase [Sporomusaceae bacterium]
MSSFDFHNPVRLIFGRGRLAEIGAIAKENGQKAIIVTSGSSGRTGLLDRVKGYLTEAGVTAVVFDKVKANPLTTTVDEGGEVARKEGCDLVIGLGGGSSMDAAKAVAFMAKNPGKAADYLYGKPGTGALPLVLVTTTAGTGSEGNCIGVLTNPENKDKKGMRGPHLYAKASIIDPELLVTLPKKSIAGPGLDALFHAIEAFIGRRSNDMTGMMALQAIRLSSENLPLVYEDPKNLAAWEKVSLANTLGGMAIDGSGTALPHGMEHPVSGLYDAPHGEGLASLYVAILEFTLAAVPEKFAQIAQAMGADISGLSVEAAAAKCIDCIKELMAKVDMPPRLKDFGAKEADIDWLTDQAINTMQVNLSNHPKTPTREEIREIYRKSM